MVSHARVLLFSGHMIDASGRATTRFPASMEPAARTAIESKLAELEAGRDALAICGGACGGDLLFAEAALARGAALALYLPFPAPVFVRRSVDFAGAAWHARFEGVLARATLHVLEDAAAGDPYERNNLRMLDAAHDAGDGQLDFVCLWDGGGGDGPGGTRHMMQSVQKRNGRVHWIDTRTLE